MNNKEMKVIEAVNALKATFPHDEDEEMSQIIVAMSDFDGYKKGSFHGGNSVKSNQYWTAICTIAEFNQCIEEMATNSWVNGGHWDYLQYKKDCELNDIDTSNKRLQKEVVEQPIYTKAMQDAGEMPSVGMKCLTSKYGNVSFKILYIGANIAVLISGTSREISVDIDLLTPIDTRTPEEKAAEELVAAKIEQVDVVINDIMCSSPLKYDEAKHVAMWIQSQGRLAEIILPLGV